MLHALCSMPNHSKPMEFNVSFLDNRVRFLSLFSTGAEFEYAELLDLIMALSKKDKYQKGEMKLTLFLKLCRIPLYFFKPIYPQR